MADLLPYLGEVIAFIVMVAVIARWGYPRVAAAAAARQRAIAEQLEAATRSRADAERRFHEAERRLEAARAQADEVVAGAERSGAQLQADLRARADEEVRRIAESARQQIAAERRRAVDQVRAEVAELVVAATEKVVKETMDPDRQRRLVGRAIASLEDGNGRRRG